MQKITPFLWFGDQAEEAVNFYVSVFRNARITNVARYGDAGAGASGRPKGTVMTVVFQLDGQEFIALNGGPSFVFSPAISFVVNCLTQDEVGVLWDRLSEGGQQLQCGWFQDKYGVSWQIVPTILGEMVADQNSAKAERVMQAMLQMTKIDIETLKKAYGNLEA
jgi:predicted 3-demethylubiquinone-9 3-methyltransferase (glyoxalase superfamily)